MNLRTQEDFLDAVSKELAWRRRELTELRRLVTITKGEQLRQAAAIRCGIALLYAHWEGFVKRVAEFYLNYVSMQRLSNEELTNCMLAVSIRAKLNAAAGANRIQSHIDVVSFLRSDLQDRARLPKKNVVNTEANLSSKVLSEILLTLGLNSLAYESKYKLLDSQLLARRNSIAHGAELELDADEYEELHTQVSELINLFRNDVENAVLTRHFQRKSMNSGESLRRL